jgi:hypothetical protein
MHRFTEHEYEVNRSEPVPVGPLATAYGAVLHASTVVGDML